MPHASLPSVLCLFATWFLGLGASPGVAVAADVGLVYQARASQSSYRLKGVPSVRAGFSGSEMGVGLAIQGQSLRYPLIGYLGQLMIDRVQMNGGVEDAFSAQGLGLTVQQTLVFGVAGGSAWNLGLGPTLAVSVSRVRDDYDVVRHLSGSFGPSVVSRVRAGKNLGLNLLIGYAMGLGMQEWNGGAFYYNGRDRMVIAAVSMYWHKTPRVGSLSP